MEIDMDLKTLSPPTLSLTLSWLCPWRVRIIGRGERWVFT